MFELHALWFGTGTDFGTLCVKTAMQIQLTGFVNAYFCLVLLWIGRGKR